MDSGWNDAVDLHLFAARRGGSRLGAASCAATCVALASCLLGRCIGFSVPLLRIGRLLTLPVLPVAPPGRWIEAQVEDPILLLGMERVPADLRSPKAAGQRALVAASERCVAQSRAALGTRRRAGLKRGRALSRHSQVTKLGSSIVFGYRI